MKKCKLGRMVFAATFSLMMTTVVANPNDPQFVGDINVSQDIARRVTITYTLDEPAIVTMDVLTNGVSIGGANIDHVRGDCFKYVSSGAHTIYWAPDKSWPGHKFTTPVVSVKLTAWAANMPPDYMVVDLTPSAVANDARFYQSVEFLPGGILSNEAYRTSKLVMRKVPLPPNGEWTMGSTALDKWHQANETAFTVTNWTNSYYIGVFEFTEAQWAYIATSRPDPAYFKVNGSMRPVEQASYYDLRCGDVTANTGSGGYYPSAPYTGSFLNLLRNKTGYDFDLPSEAQWEYACRAGHGDNYWGNGVSYANGDSNGTIPGRYQGNGGQKPKDGGGYQDWPNTVDETGATAICGSYAPNSWGIYDMHGNSVEWCLDKYAADITGNNGDVYTTGADSANRVYRGGSWNYAGYASRSFTRSGIGPGTRYRGFGFRVVCPALAH